MSSSERLIITDQWEREDVGFIRKNLTAYTRQHVPFEQSKYVVLLLKDDQQNIRGGLLAKVHWGRMKIEIVWVEDSLRGSGYGGQLVKRVEEVAKHHNCHLIVLETFSFHAPNFYRKLGYVEYGRLPDYPKIGEMSYLFMKKLS